MELAVVLITAPRGKGADIARALVEERLAACANIVGGVRSIYWWQGKVEDDEEDLIIVKTKKCLLSQLKAKVRETHPYSVLEIVALTPVDVLEDYLAWALGETAGCPGGESQG